MDHRQAKDALFDGFADVAKALASGRRAELIDILEQGERHVEPLAAEINQSVANTSFHLRTLAAAGLVATRRDGTRVYYRLASGRVGELWAALRDVAIAHHGRLDRLVDDYVGDREKLDHVGRDDLARRLAAGEVTVIDVRPPAEYEAGHIDGARSIPFASLQELLRELPDDLEVVAYCRDPFCLLADDAVQILTEHGRPARRLEGGFPQWERDRLPVG
ncbi:MAG: ArsR/SmtB family transcription factor, partial [Acidimicrobiales bacterium]